MSRGNRLGQIRRSQVLGYGPGAIIDFRAGAMGGGPVSVIAASLESWDITAKTKGSTDPHIVHEERLQKVLGKQYFRLPPIDDSQEGEDLNRWLRGYRFPQWLQCPGCKELRFVSKWAKDIGDPSRWCSTCSNKDRRMFVVPLRFVTACENGHIDEFPWHWWLRTRSDTGPSCGGESEEGGCRLALESVGGSGLEGLVLRCRNKGCNARASMAGAFSMDALKGFKCAGRRPWLTKTGCDCDARPRTLQRGASNLYFPVTYSTLSIPPWTDRLQEDIRPFWETLKKSTGDLRETLISSLADTHASQHSMPPAAFANAVRNRLQLDQSTSLETLRVEEYSRLTADGTGDSDTFQIKQETVPASLQSYVEQLARVERLREVRALTGFKRIYQPISVEDPGQGRFGDLYDPAQPLPWLPAAEVRGEGIFFTLRRSFVEAWEGNNPDVADRAAAVARAAAEHWAQHHGDAEGAPAVTPTYLLVHSLAHAVIKRLSFECGYDVASLRERLYIGTDPWMAGILIYTSASDADGTLGGLERQGKPSRFEQIIERALHDAVWCSSDPLCRDGVCSTSESMNLAACHSCLLLPETCCEQNNRYLDRLTLITDEADAAQGYFNALLQPENEDAE